MNCRFCREDGWRGKNARFCPACGRSVQMAGAVAVYRRDYSPYVLLGICLPVIALFAGMAFFTLHR